MGTYNDILIKSCKFSLKWEIKNNLEKTDVSYSDFFKVWFKELFSFKAVHQTKKSQNLKSPLPRHYIEGGVKLLFTSKKNYTLKKYTTLISFFSENIQFFK